MKKKINFSYVFDHVTITDLAVENNFVLTSPDKDARWITLERGLSESVSAIKDGDNLFLGRGSESISVSNDGTYFFDKTDSTINGSILSFASKILKQEDPVAFLEERLGDAIYDMDYVSVKAPYNTSQQAFDIDKANYVHLYDIYKPEKIPAISIFARTNNFDMLILSTKKFNNSIGLIKQVFPDNEVVRVAFPLTKVDESGNKIYTGLAFMAARLNEETKVWEQRELFQQGSSKQEGIWRTNISNDMLKQQYVNIVVVKSPVEAIALEAIGRIPNSIYVSTMGSATKGQIRQIRAIENRVNKFCKSRVIIALGNETEDLKESIKLATKLGKVNEFAPQKTDSYPNTMYQKVFVDYAGGSSVKLTMLVLEETSKEVANKVIRSLQANINDANKTETAVEASDTKPKHTLINITMPATKENLSNLNKALSDVLSVKIMQPQQVSFVKELAENKNVKAKVALGVQF